MAKKSSSSSLESLKNASLLAAFLLVVWGFYRLIFRLPEEVEELFIKPVVWLLPVFYFLRKEGKGISSLGFTLKKSFSSCLFFFRSWFYFYL